MASSAVLVSSPFEASAASVTSGSDSEPLVGELVKKAYSAFAIGDIPGVLKLFSPGIVWETATPRGRPYKARYQGTADVQEFFAALLDKESVEQFDVTSVVAQGDTAVGLINWSTSVKATGKPYSLVLIHKWTLGSDGKLASFKEYFSDDAAATAAFEG